MKCLSLEILAGTSVWVLTSKGTGTVRSAVKPPLVARDGERKPDASYNPVPPFTPIRGNQGSLSGFPSLSYGMPSSNENGKDHDKSSEISYTEDIHLTSSNLGPSGTVVVRSSRESLEHQGPDWESKKEYQVPHLKTVQRILLRPKLLYKEA